MASFSLIISDIIIRKMDNKQSQQSQSTKVWPIFIISILAGGSTITLTVLLYIWSYFGFSGNSPQSITGCSTIYNTYKYSNLTLLNETVFVGSTVSAFSGLLVILMSVRLLYRKCINEIKISQCFKGTFYLFVSLMNLGSVICFGYYMTFVLQVGGQCTFVANTTEVIVILVLSGVTLLQGLILLLITLCLKVGQSNQQKYRYVDTRQTQPRQYLKHNQKERAQPLYFTKPRQEYKPRFFQRQQTKDNIYDIPSKSPFEKGYKRERPDEREKIYLQKRKYDSDPVDPKMRFVPRNKQQNIVLNLHPTLANDKDHNLKSMMEEDDKYLREEQKKYLNDFNNRPPPILGRGPQDIRDRNRYHQSRQQDSYQGNNRNNRYGRPSRNNFYDDRRRSRRQDPQDSYQTPPNRYLRDNDPPRRRRESPQRYNNRSPPYYDRD